MRALRYSINVTLDGCCHHEAGLPPDEESMRYWAAEMERADALLFGRVTYEMMESAWRRPASGIWPDWMGEWELPFAEAIDGAKKHVVSNTLDAVDWNAELVAGDLGQAVQRLKEAQKLGFGRAMLPAASMDREAGFGSGMTGLDQLAGLVAAIAASGPKGGRTEAVASRQRRTETDEAVRS